MTTEAAELMGKLHHRASTPSTGCRNRAAGTRMPHMAMPRMSMGASTAPVARTTPDSTKVTPKNRKEPIAMWLRWRATSSDALPVGRNQPST